MHLLDLLPHALDDLAGILPLAHEDDPLDEVVIVVLAEDAQADACPDAHGANIANAHRRPLLRGHHDVIDVLGGLDEADAAHHEGVLALPNVATSCVRVVAGHGIEDLLEGQVVGA